MSAAQKIGKEWKECDGCDGSGTDPNEFDGRCLWCMGHGSVVVEEDRDDEGDE